jgi:DNA-binding XRE family transcriptional regulator
VAFFIALGVAHLDICFNIWYKYIVIKYNSTLKDIRKKKGWSQERLARELGVSFQTIHRWEAGKFNPSPLAKEKIDILVTRNK